MHFFNNSTLTTCFILQNQFASNLSLLRVLPTSHSTSSSHVTSISSAAHNLLQACKHTLAPLSTFCTTITNISKIAVLLHYRPSLCFAVKIQKQTYQLFQSFLLTHYFLCRTHFDQSCYSDISYARIKPFQWGSHDKYLVIHLTLCVHVLEWILQFFSWERITNNICLQLFDY
jgi:hypothetical protein